MPTVVITQTRKDVNTEPSLSLFRENGFEVRMVEDFRFARGLTSDEHVIEVLGGASAVIAQGTRYTANVLKNLPDLRVVARSGVGYDKVDVAAASANDIVVAITPNANYEAVAEHAMALILALAKSLLSGDRTQRAGEWPNSPRRPLRDSTLGIVGLGRIGRSLAVSARAMKMRVTATELYPDEAFVKENGIELVDLDTLLKSADFVSLHCPLADDTRGIINSRTLALMKPEASLVNTARGGLIVEADLVDALRAGQIASAGIDVFEQEPADKENPLYELDNVIVSPHVAGVDHLSVAAMRIEATNCIISLYKGQWPEGAVVNDELKGQWRW